MSFLIKIRQKLSDSRLRNIDPDSPEFTEMHRKILSERKYMQDVSRDIYDKAMHYDNIFLKGEGLKVELGAGSSFFKNIYPEIISSDIKTTPYTEMVVDAQAMPFKDSLSG